MFKIDELGLLGLLPKTLKDIELDPVRLVVDDEFNRPDRTGLRKDYRLRAIDRLIADRLPLRSEHNIEHNVVRKFVRLICPYCDDSGSRPALPIDIEMRVTGGTGNGSGNTTQFKCPACGSTASLTLGEYDLCFQPLIHKTDG